MVNLSPDKNVDFISLGELADTLNGSSSQIQLPSFQRDAVWDEARIELLWDSLYRGYPIGSLLFADVSKLQGGTINVRNTQLSRSQAAHPVRREPKETQYVIIDGQQRAIAIALGFRPFEENDAARLWIDLGATDDKCPFSICTLQQPWGLETSHRQISQAKKEHLDSKLLNARGELESITLLEHTWPLRCSLPVPLEKLLTWLEDKPNSSWRDLVPMAKRTNDARPDLDKVFQTLRALRDNQIPIYLVRQMSSEKLGEIFQRLNKQGIAMTDSELFFSALKMKWPQAHNLVWSIYADRGTGSLMTSREIVHLAVRLVFGSKRHIARLNLDEFERLANDPLQFETLQDWLKKDDAKQHGRLHTLLRQARQTISYNPKNGEDDPGLPTVLLAQLPARVWHTLVAWLSNNQQNPVSAHTREEMIRYAMLDYYFSGNATQRLERIPFKEALQISEDFPGFEIYAALWQAGQLETKIPTVQAFQMRLEEAANPPGALFKKEIALSLWVQRASLQNWFPNFDPTRYGSKQDYPYDRDHILPSAYNYLRGRTQNSSPSQEFWNWRHRVINSSGNLRYWPANLNRSDQHKNLDRKFLLGDANTPTNSTMLEAYNLETIGQVRDASFLEDTQIENWTRAANIPRPYDWQDPDRIRALRKATEARRLRLYQLFHEGLGFQQWHNKFTPWLVDRIRQRVKEGWLKDANPIKINIQDIVEELSLDDEYIPEICTALDGLPHLKKGGQSQEQYWYTV